MFDCDSIRFSESLEALTAVKPHAPTNLRKNPYLRYKDQIVVEWLTPSNDGGSPLYIYTLGIKEVGSSNPEKFAYVSASANTYTFTLLTPGS